MFDKTATPGAKVGGAVGPEPAAGDRHWLERHAKRDRHGRPVVPQQRDLEVIQALWRGGFLTMRMIAAEWWPGRALRVCRRRLMQLVDVGWLARYRPRLLAAGGSHEFVYY